MNELRDANESAEATEPHDPTESTEPPQPIDPIESTEPTEPIESTDPSLAIERIESVDLHDQRELTTRLYSRSLPAPRSAGRLQGRKV